MLWRSPRRAKKSNGRDLNGRTWDQMPTFQPLHGSTGQRTRKDRDSHWRAACVGPMFPKDLA